MPRRARRRRQPGSGADQTSALKDGRAPMARWTGRRSGSRGSRGGAGREARGAGAGAGGAAAGPPAGGRGKRLTFGR